MSYRPPNPSDLNRDITYTTEPGGILAFKNLGYELDGIEGYIYKLCTPEPSCIPPGAVRLYRLYLPPSNQPAPNPPGDDYAIFPESEEEGMRAAGYVSTPDFNDWIGYVYPNVDSDFDNLINGFEGLIGTNSSRSDSDCDGLSDGTEALNYPYGDPLVVASGVGCVPPVARFTFTCSGLSCSFNASSSTDNVGIVSYAWSFGDSTIGFGITTNHTYAATNTYTVTLTVTDTHGLQASTSRKVSVSSEVPGAAEGFFTVPPCRLADTRATTPLTSGVQRTFQVTGLCGIPATAKAVSFNVTVVSPTGQGFLVLFPGNQTSVPFAQSSINFNPANAPRANNAILRLATNGAGTINVLPATPASPLQVHVILDVDGYFSGDAVPAAGAQGPYGFQSVLPCRVADTRTSTAIAANTTRDFIVQGFCGVPAGAAATALNTVIIMPTANGYATLFQTGAFPPVSTINFNAGAVLANGARTRLAPTTPDLSLLYFAVPGASTHALVDVYGYFKSDAPLKYRPIIACRTVDTRFADQGGPVLGVSETRNFQIRGNCGVPASAKAVAVNITTTDQAGQGFLYVYPAGGAVPGASYINFNSGQGPLSNGGIVALSTLPNDLAITASNGTNVLLDVYGYFE